MDIQEIRSKYPQYNDMTDTQLADALHAKYYSDMPKDAVYQKLGIQQQAQAPEGDSGIMGDIKNAAGGFARSGMGLVSNLMRPIDALTGANDPTMSSLITGKPAMSAHEQRMARIDARFKNQGYDPNSLSFKGGKLGGDVLATAPVGGALAKLVPLVSKAPLAAKFANSIAPSGLRTGAPVASSLAGRAADMGIRMAGGGITGGATTGLIDPGSEGTGAMIGAALPSSLKVAAKATQLVKRGVGAATSNILGASTGTGAESGRAAYAAGKTGSSKFLDNMRGKVSIDDVVGEAKGALSKMREARAADYRSGMVDISNDKSVIDFQPIQDAMSRIGKMGSYKGQQINKHAAGTVDDLMATVDNWGGLDPAEYHTPEGLDALKQAIGDIRDSTQFGTAARRAADEVYNAVKNQITAQAPTYSKVMKDYSEASALLKEIESGLSLGSKASKDTAVRKLQSLLRNNAQTNYGNRLNLARKLEEKGGPDLMPALAGQSMSSAMPRGLSGGIQKAGALGIGVTSPASIPALLAAAPFTSPRLVGEGLYRLGRLTSGPANLLSAGKHGANRLAAQHPGLLDLENALYRSLPVMATSLGKLYGENHE